MSGIDSVSEGVTAVKSVKMEVTIKHVGAADGRVENTAKSKAPLDSRCHSTRPATCCASLARSTRPIPSSAANLRAASLTKLIFLALDSRRVLRRVRRPFYTPLAKRQHNHTHRIDAVNLSQLLHAAPYGAADRRCLAGRRPEQRLCQPRRPARREELLLAVSRFDGSRSARATAARGRFSRPRAAVVGLPQRYLRG